MLKDDGEEGDPKWVLRSAFASVRFSDIIPTLRIAAAKFLHKRVTTYFRKHRLKRKTYPF